MREKDEESLDFCEKKKDKDKCDQFKMDCLVTCGFCNPNITTNITKLPPTNTTTLPPTNITTLPPTTDECEGVEKDEESLDFCEKKKDKDKCDQFKKDCLVTCGFCNPNITTNITTLPPTNITTLPPTTDECEGVE